MKTYYTKPNGTFFCEHKDLFGRRTFKEFDIRQKEWKYADWEMQKDQITEVAAVQAAERLQAHLLEGVDRKRLCEYINLLCQNRKVDWHTMENKITVST